MAYLVGDADSIAFDELRDLLRSSLPEYMIPSGFALLDEFPLIAERQGRPRRPGRPAARGGGARAHARAAADRDRGAARRGLEEDPGGRRVGVYDNFFELGGHSLIAVRLFSEIERRLHATLPLSALFETATIAGLAELIERDRRDQTDWSSLVPLRPGKELLPLFLIGWAGGEVLPYRDLIENLDPDLPVYGLRAPASTGKHSRFTRSPSWRRTTWRRSGAHSLTGPTGSAGSASRVSSATRWPGSSRRKERPFRRSR